MSLITTNNMNSKITTICGAISIIAGTIVASNFDPLVTKIASCVATAATGLGLFFARDNNVSDEQAGANNNPPAQPK